MQRINPPGLSTPTTYSHIVKAGNTLYIAGQVGSDAQGKVVGPGMAEQLEQVLKNLQTALKSQGADFSHVGEDHDLHDRRGRFPRAEAAAVRAKYFGATVRPARWSASRGWRARSSRSRSKRRRSCLNRSSQFAIREFAIRQARLRSGQLRQRFAKADSGGRTANSDRISR